jgi:hypothetical protein
MAGSGSEIDPLRAGAFNAVGDCYVPSRQDALMVWYATALSSLAASVCHVPWYMIQVGPSDLVDIVPALPLGGS